MTVADSDAAQTQFALAKLAPIVAGIAAGVGVGFILFSHFEKKSQAEVHGDAGSLNTDLLRRYQYLTLLTNEIVSHTDQEKTLSRIIRAAHHVVGADKVVLGLIDNTEQVIVIEDSIEKKFQPKKVPLHSGILGYVALTAKPANLDDAYLDPRFCPASDEFENYKTQSLLALPIRDADGIVVAVLHAVNKKGKSGNIVPFDRIDEEFIGMVADCAGSVVRRIQYMESARKEKIRADTLLEVMKTVTSSGMDHNAVVNRIVSLVYGLIRVERVALFLVNCDDEDSDPYLTLAISKDATGARIPLTQGVAGYVARSRQAVVIDDAYSDCRFDSSVDARTGFRTRNILCVPVVDFHGEVIGVLQAVNKICDEPSKAQNRAAMGDVLSPRLMRALAPVVSGFTKQDEEILTSFGSQVGQTILMSSMLEESKRTERKMAALLDVIKAVSDPGTTHGGMRRLIQVVIDAVYKFLDADRVTLFMCDTIKREVWLAVSEDSAAEGMRLPYGSGIVGKVAETGKTINVANAYGSQSGHNATVDETTGYKTISVLAVPVMDLNGEPIAVLQALNKRSDLSTKHSCTISTSCGVNFKRAKYSGAISTAYAHVIPFDTHDENILLSFCNEIGVALKRRSLEMAYEKVLSNQQDVQLELTSFVSLYTNQTPLNLNATLKLSRANPITRFDVISEEKERHYPELTWETDVFQLSGDHLILTLVTVGDMVHYSREIFISCGVVDNFNIPIESLNRFLASVSQTYRPVIFHSFTHGFSVLQVAYLILKNTNALDYLTQLDVFVVLVAALCHDLDHPGVNQTFLINAGDEMAITHNDISVLENHHAKTLSKMLQKHDQDITQNLSKEDRKKFRTSVIAAILSTDMQHHRSHCDRLQLLDAARPFDMSVADDRQLLINTIVHGADLSGQVMPPEISKVWGDRVLREFTSQVEKERKAELDVTPFMDNLTEVIPACKLQLGFIDYVLAPYWDSVVRIFPTLQCLTDNLKLNRADYQETLDQYLLQQAQQKQ